MRKLLTLLLLVLALPAHAAITYVGASGAANNTNGAAISPGVDGSTASGDAVLCLVGQKNATNYTTITNSVGGYTRLIGVAGSSGSTLTYWAKISAGSESAPTFESTDTTAGRTIIGQCVTFRGTLNTVSGIVAHSATGSGAAAAAITTPALTVTTDNTLVVAGGIRANQWAAEDIGALSTMTEIGQPERTSSAQVALKWDRVIQTTAGNISSGTWTSTVNTAAYAAIVISIKPAASAPTWSVSPTVSAQDDNDYTLSYTPSTSATFYAVACAKDETAPTIAQVKAAHCTGDAAAIASANEAVTGADTTVLGGSLTRPVHDLYAVLSNAAGDSTLVTLADECLDAAAGKTIVNCPSGLTSIHANSPINGFNAAVTPDIVAGDIMVADSATDLGDALTWTATGLYSYDGNSARRKFSANFYDLSAGANHADTMQVCVNNAAPVASVAYYDAVLVKDHPFTAIDFCTMFSDADDPTLTCTSDETGTGTGAGTRPAGTTMTSGVFDDTGAGATSADASTGSLTVTATDSCGDTATIPFTWSVYSQVTVPDCVAGSLSACITALAAVNLDVTFESQCNATAAALNVVSQTPAASTVVDPFTSVDLAVSSGPCGGRRGRLMLGIGVR